MGLGRTSKKGLFIVHRLFIHPRFPETFLIETVSGIITNTAIFCSQKRVFHWTIYVTLVIEIIEGNPILLLEMTDETWNVEGTFSSSFN